MCFCYLTGRLYEVECRVERKDLYRLFIGLDGKVNVALGVKEIASLLSIDKIRIECE